VDIHSESLLICPYIPICNEARIFGIQIRKVDMNILKLIAYISIFCITCFVGFSAAKGIGSIRGVFTEPQIPATELQSVSTPAPTFESILAPTTLQAEPAESFDPSGEYYLDTNYSGTAFKDVEIGIYTREYSENEGVYTNVPTVPSGTLYANREYALSKIAIGDRELTFETETVGGIKYKFVGYFPMMPSSSCESCEFPPNLKGKLTKIKGGKAVAAEEVSFYLGDGC
jgi:hypothetical protein